MSIAFKGNYLLNGIIVLAVFFYVCQAVSAAASPAGIQSIIDMNAMANWSAQPLV